ncbi:MAG: hypothetical protein HYV97_03760 [Bdellovibrio sp.]|nr:hypothetical protein [Bdellovibrio sp.]
MPHTSHPIINIPQIECMDRGILHNELKKYVPHFFDGHESLAKLREAFDSMFVEVKKNCSILEVVSQELGENKENLFWITEHLESIRKQVQEIFGEKLEVSLKYIVGMGAANGGERQFQLVLEISNRQHYFELLLPALEQLCIFGIYAAKIRDEFDHVKALGEKLVHLRAHITNDKAKLENLKRERESTTEEGQEETQLIDKRIEQINQGICASENRSKEKSSMHSKAVTQLKERLQHSKNEILKRKFFTEIEYAEKMDCLKSKIEKILCAENSHIITTTGNIVTSSSKRGFGKNKSKAYFSLKIGIAVVALGTSLWLLRGSAKRNMIRPTTSEDKIHPDRFTLTLIHGKYPIHANPHEYGAGAFMQKFLLAPELQIINSSVQDTVENNFKKVITKIMEGNEFNSAERYLSKFLRPVLTVRESEIYVYLADKVVPYLHDLFGSDSKLGVWVSDNKDFYQEFMPAEQNYPIISIPRNLVCSEHRSFGILVIIPLPFESSLKITKSLSDSKGEITKGGLCNWHVPMTEKVDHELVKKLSGHVFIQNYASEGFKRWIQKATTHGAIDVGLTKELELMDRTKLDEEFSLIRKSSSADVKYDKRNGKITMQLNASDRAIMESKYGRGFVEFLEFKRGEKERFKVLFKEQSQYSISFNARDLCSAENVELGIQINLPYSSGPYSMQGPTSNFLKFKNFLVQNGACK